ncbi:MAG: ABC transporter permease [Nitrospirae bacterium]|nr:ABC transporter permease [Nitrospirota bacterium]
MKRFPFREEVVAALQALLANKVRSGLTMLGVVIGVLAVILLVSLGLGARAYVLKELSGMGSNLLVIVPGKTETKGGFHPPSAGTIYKLTYDDALHLKRRAWALSDAVPIVLGTSKIKFKNLSRDTTVIGTTPGFEQVRNLHVGVGSFVRQEDVDAKRKVVVLGQRVRRELFGEISPLGQMATLGDAKYRVIGIMEPKGVSLGVDLDDVIFIPATSAQELFDTDRLFEILAAARSKEEMSLAIQQVREALMRRHNHKEDFTILTQGDMISVLDRLLTIMTGVLAGIAGISLLVGGIGIMNIMLVAVRERTREIGIRKAVGARRRDILRQFLLESAVLSGLGGVGGIVLSVGIAWLLPLLYPAIPMLLSAEALLLAFGFSVAVGLFFGVYPAKQAAWLDPIEALRYE